MKIDSASRVLLGVIIAIVAFFIGRGTVPHAVEGFREVHDTTVVVHTIRDTVREVRFRDRVRLDTVRLAAVPDATAGTRADSSSVEVPIERVVVNGDYYTATLEGFRPRLVDMELRIPERIVTATRTETIRKRWSFVAGPQVGAGWTPEGVRPYVGIGVSFGYCF